MITQTLQSPPIFSGTYNPLVWMVESNATGNYNFKYVFDVYVGGSTGPIRFKTPPNPYGKGIIDVNALSQGELNFTINLPMLSATPFTTGQGLCGTVYIKVGEEYSVGANGDVILYNGLGATGQPAYGLYANGDFRPAPNNTTPVTTMSWGQSASQYYDYISLGGESVLDYMMAKSWNSPDSKGKWLTRWPSLSQTIRSDEDFTISWVNYDPEAPNYRQIPYAMVVKGYNNGELVGQNTYYNTVANGGSWPTCSTPATGPTADVYISSFKVNPAELTFSGSATRDKQDLFGPTWNWTTYTPTPDCFPDSFTPVGSTLVWNVYDNGDYFLEIGATGITGSSNILYRNMTVATGSSITIMFSSPNFFFGDYGDLQLWGYDGTWHYLETFYTQEVFGGTSNYIVNGYTTIAPYTALGLRYNRTTPKEDNFLLGPTMGLWDITGPSGPQEFDSFCLALYPYDDYTTCTVGDTPDSEVMCLTIDDTNCWGFEPIRFSWLNNLGGRDYYTFIKRNTNVQNATRNTLYKIQGYWSAATYNVQDNSPARWGTQIFRADLTNTWTASTNWLSDEESTFLRNMFASPHVLVYLPGRSQPTMVTITDASYTVNTTVREKLFQYFVSFTESQPDVVQSF
jgi:hypothetical protein